MKTAISVPDPIFGSAERLVRRMKKARSQVYSEAVAEYVAATAPQTDQDEEMRADPSPDSGLTESRIWHDPSAAVPGRTSRTLATIQRQIQRNETA